METPESISPSLLDAVSMLHKTMMIGPKIGEGTFSTVYQGIPNFMVPGIPDKLAIKLVSQLVKPAAQANELRMLTLLNGERNVVRVIMAFRHQDSLALVMPYYEHDKFNKLIKVFTCDDVRHYMRSLLVALEHVHSHRIIHRDIKPNNFLYCSRTRKCALVDFGLAQYECEINNEIHSERIPLQDMTDSTLNNTPSMEKRSVYSCKVIKCRCRGKNQVCRDCIAAPGMSAPRAGTAGYRPPEVLLKCVKQSTAVDVWACGIMLFSILSGRANLFNAPDDLTSLAQLITIFGEDAMQKAALKMNKLLIVDLNKRVPSKTLKEICEELQLSKFKACRLKGKDPVTFPDAAYDLLEKLLKLTPSERITATEALGHPFLVN